MTEHRGRLKLIDGKVKFVCAAMKPSGVSRLPEGLEIDDDGVEAICKFGTGGLEFVRLLAIEQPTVNKPGDQPGNAASDRFIYPANFVPFGPSVEAGTVDEAWGATVGHDHLDPQRWSGRLAVVATVTTPVLLPDPMTASFDKSGHVTYGIARVGNEVVVSPTAIRGPLRSLFEAITNSRLGVSTDWSSPLAHRMTAGQARNVRPCRLHENPDGSWSAEVFAENARDVAFLPMYGNGRDGVPRSTRSDEALKQGVYEHAAEVTVKVKTVALDRGGTVQYVDPNGPSECTGIVFMSGPNAANKRHERVLFPTGGRAPLAADRFTRYGQLLQDYCDLHEGEDLDAKPPHEAPEWSAHIRDRKRRVVADGHLCFALLSGSKILDLLPVFIGRRLYENAPADLVPPGLQPAAGIGELSPADRVFGWVNQQANDDGAAFASQVRIPAVHLSAAARVGAPSVDGSPVTLAELSSPKPSSARVYAATDQHGTPLPAGSARDDAFGAKGGLRGRKMYVAQQPGSWSTTHEKTERNRSISEAVLEGSKLHFTVEFRNLSSPELGALLWIVTVLGRLRIGHGKPLGYGTLNLELDTKQSAFSGPSSNATGQINPHASAYLALTGRSASIVADGDEDADGGEVVGTLVSSFVNALSLATKGRHEQILGAATVIHFPGTSIPVRYPPPFNPKDGGGYEWFVANEVERDKRRPGLSVPAAAAANSGDELALVNRPQTPPGGGNQQGGNRGSGKGRR